MKKKCNITIKPSQEILPTVYSGILEVDEGAFSLDADRYIVRDSEIAFMLSGSDQWGDFKIQGVAKKTPQGSYIGTHLKLIYPKYDNEDLATIQFDVLTFSAKKAKCFVKGQWRQYGDAWDFTGSLGRYKPELQC